MKKSNDNLSISKLKYLLFLSFLCLLSVGYVFSQKEKHPESQVTVVSGPIGSFNYELISQCVVESRKETVIVYVFLEEFDNTKSLDHRIDSLVINTFLVYQGKRMKFDIVTNQLKDKFLIGVDRKGANMKGYPIQLRDNENLKHKLFVPGNQELLRKIPIALIYSDDFKDKTLKTDLEKVKMMDEPSENPTSRKNIYKRLSHYYILYYQLKMIGQ